MMTSTTEWSNNMTDERIGIIPMQYGVQPHTTGIYKKCDYTAEL